MDATNEQVSILLVNDRPAQLMAWQSILSDLGQHLVTARTGEEALEHLLTRDFAAILLDVHMPGLDGFETAALIRQRPRCEHTPILFVSAINTQDRDRARGYALGAVDYIFTPVVPEVLRAKVGAFVELHRKSQQVAQQAAQLVELNQVLEAQLSEITKLNAELTRANDELRAETAERRRAEARLRRAHAGLEDRVRERTAELAEANAGLQAANAQLAAEMAERQRAESRRAAQYAVTRCLAEAASLDAAAPQILEAVCQNLAWDVGEIWLVDRQAGGLVRQSVWYAAAGDFARLERASAGVVLQPGSGVPGRVWQSGEPLWLPDLADETAIAISPARQRPAYHAGLRAAYGFPMRNEGHVIGVLSFFSRESRVPDPDLYHLLASVASQVGQFLERRRAEDALRRAHAELEQRVRERTAELAEANAELAHSREQLRRLTAHVEALREEERARIAHEVHDDLGGALTGLKMDVARLRRSQNGANPKLLSDIEHLNQAIDAIIQSVRRIATELRPAILDDFGLPAAIEWQLREFAQRSGLQGQIHLEAEGVSLPPQTATALFRVFQEALTNVARHAQATQVEVALALEAGHLVLRVADNGRGITAEEIRHARSFGLVGMRERVHLLQGELAITGQPGRGTAVVVRIPLQTEPALA